MDLLDLVFGRFKWYRACRKGHWEYWAYDQWHSHDWFRRETCSKPTRTTPFGLDELLKCEEYPIGPACEGKCNCKEKDQNIMGIMPVSGMWE